jgi:hypothetical protein
MAFKSCKLNLSDEDVSLDGGRSELRFRVKMHRTHTIVCYVLMFAEDMLEVGLDRFEICDNGI